MPSDWRKPPKCTASSLSDVAVPAQRHEIQHNLNVKQTHDMVHLLATVPNVLLHMFLNKTFVVQQMCRHFD
jgi:hypothetical protein